MGKRPVCFQHNGNGTNDWGGVGWGSRASQRYEGVGGNPIFDNAPEGDEGRGQREKWSGRRFDFD